MQIELSQPEQEFLVTLLEEHYRGMLTERNRTDSLAFKETLRAREALLESVLQKLGVKKPLEALR